MTIFKGPLDLKGSFGNFRIYKDPVLGITILSGKGGPSAEKMKTLETLAGARACAHELGGRSKWASSLKTSLSDINHLMYQRCFNKISTAGSQIQKQDVESAHGFRTIAVSLYPEVLYSIDFNQRFPFRNVFKGNPVIDLSSDKKTVTTSIPGFIPSKDINWGLKYGYYRFYMVAAQVSDMAINPGNGKYEPVVEKLETLSVCTVSKWLPRNSLPVDVLLQATFEQPALTSPGTVVVVALGIELSTALQQGQPYAAPRSGSMGIIAGFTE
jgi:hypothetical protein